ncbi:MAG: YHS domain-containing protein [Armatimonadota bacterium]
MAVDPVCGMVVSQEHAAACSEYAGRHYCFCSQECKDEFDSDPEFYAAESEDTIQEDEDAS